MATTDPKPLPDDVPEIVGPPEEVTDDPTAPDVLAPVAAGALQRDVIRHAFACTIDEAAY